MGESNVGTVCERQYLFSSYPPDRELVGESLVERNLGTPLHSLLQLIVGTYLRNVCRGSYVFVEARLLVNSVARTYRIPDVMVVERPLTPGRAIVDVPAVVIEIKSPDDTLDAILGNAWSTPNWECPTSSSWIRTTPGSSYLKTSRFA